MYARRLKCRNHYLSSLLQKSEYSFRSTSKDIYQADSHKICHQLKDSIIRNCSNHYTRSQSGDFLRFRACHPISSFNTSRFFSSKGDGNNASEGKHCPVKDASSFENGSTGTEQIVSHPKHNNEHAWLGKQDQQEWLDLEKLSIESKRKESPFLTKRHKFKNEFLRRVVPWDRIKVSWSKFPYAFHEHTKNLLVECAASHLRHKGVASSFGVHLTSSSGRIMLQGVPGTELYRERMVKALAREMQVPLLILDSNVLAPYDFGQECLLECDSDDDNAESGDETTESDAEETNASNGEWTSSNEGKSGESDDDDDDAQSSAEAIKKLVPHSLEEFAKRVSGETEDSTPATESTSATPSKRPLRKGDRVKYAGATVHLEVENRSLVAGQRGEVYEINGDQVAVILDNADNQLEEGNNTEFGKQPDGKPSVYWIDIQDIVQDLDTQTEDWLISLEALCEILPSLQPVIVYFPDCSQWLSKAVPRSNRKEFISKVEQMFDQIKEPVVFICGENVTETGSKEKGKFTMVLPGLGRVAQVPLPLKRLTEGLGASKSSKDKDISQLFNNIISIHPPEEEEQLRIFNKQVEVDQGIITSRNNLIELHKVLREHDLACVDILEVKTDGIVLTKQQAEKVAGWAKIIIYPQRIHPPQRVIS